MTEATPARPCRHRRFAGSDWFDPLEEAVRGQVRSFIEELLEEELEAALGRDRYERHGMASGHRHGRRPRQLVTTFGPLELSVPRARLHDAAGEQEWKSELLPAYKRLSHRAEALIAQAYLAGMNTRRVRRALASCSPATSARMWSAAPGSGPARPGRAGSSVILPAMTSSG